MIFRYPPKPRGLPISILYPRGSFHLGCHLCRFILGAVYIHPNVPQESMEYFMIQMLGAYSEAIRLIFPSMNPDTETPILLCGDSTRTSRKIVVCKLYEIEIQFGLQEFRVHNSRQYMHRSKFTRNVSVQTLPYVSDFSYHRPVLNRLILNNNEL
jgi:hypothetical protein